MVYMTMAAFCLTLTVSAGTRHCIYTTGVMVNTSPPKIGILLI
jgi:hypothetical protein